MLEWINGEKWRGSLLKYKVPTLVSGPRKFWAYLKKDVRRWYRTKIQKKVDNILRKYNISYLCDVDPKDYENIKPNQKTDRQILFWMALFWWVVETIWEMVFPAKPTKTKSKIKGSKKKTEAEAEEKPTDTNDTKKSKREKIE